MRLNCLNKNSCAQKANLKIYRYDLLVAIAGDNAIRRRRFLDLAAGLSTEDAGTFIANCAAFAGTVMLTKVTCYMVLELSYPVLALKRARQMSKMKINLRCLMYQKQHGPETGGHIVHGVGAGLHQRRRRSRPVGSQSTTCV